MGLEIHELFLRASVGSQNPCSEDPPESNKNTNRAATTTQATEQVLDVLNRKNER